MVDTLINIIGASVASCLFVAASFAVRNIRSRKPGAPRVRLTHSAGDLSGIQFELVQVKKEIRLLQNQIRLNNTVSKGIELSEASNERFGKSNALRP